MKCLISFFLFLCTVCAYERINLYSDNYAIFDVNRDIMNDQIRITSESEIGADVKTYSQVDITIPEGIEEISFVLTDIHNNTGRYIYETPFSGVHLTIKYDHRRPLTGLCEYFSKVLPCFGVKQCNTTHESSVYNFDLDDIVWTPVELVPYSVLKPTIITGKEWVRVANIIVPYDYLHLEHYHSGGCPSSVYNHIGIFHLKADWYPHTSSANLRFVTITLFNSRSKDIHLFDSFTFRGPLLIPSMSSIDDIDSPTDLIIHELKENSEFHRFTAKGNRIMYAIREFPFWTGEMEMKILDGDQLYIDTMISASHGSYNPYYPVYDSRIAIALYLPRGVYVDHAELVLMYSRGKIPAYVVYQEHVDTEMRYEEAKPQIIIFIAEAIIYPL